VWTAKMLAVARGGSGMLVGRARVLRPSLKDVFSFSEVDAGEIRTF